MASGRGLSLGSRVNVPGRGDGLVALDNEDGTWNVEFDDGTEGDIASAEITLCADQSLDGLPLCSVLSSNCKLIAYYAERCKRV